MNPVLGQFADLDGWLRVVVTGIALFPLILLVAIILPSLVEWVRDPKKIWPKRK